VGLLLFRRGRRNHEQGESRRVSPVGCRQLYFCLLLNGLWSRVWFRPRVLRDVTTVDFSTHILGHPTKMPIYIVCDFLTVSPCAIC
jgi:hypothetical protein